MSNLASVYCVETLLNGSWKRVGSFGHAKDQAMRSAKRRIMQRCPIRILLVDTNGLSTVVWNWSR